MAEFKQFYLFGSPIRQSLSPLLHQTGFDKLSLPYRYDLCETTDIELIEKLVRQPNFGGASVTIPLKSSLWKLVTEVSDPVREIGAMNTIVKLPNGQLYGDNTDWKGVYKLLNDVIPETQRNSCQIILVGAGGAARAVLYALKKLGFTSTIFLYNPYDFAQAQVLAKENIVAVNDQSVFKKEKIGLILSTVPASCEFTFDDNSVFYSNESPPVVFDLNYIPYETQLIKQGQETKSRIIRGIDLLIEQGFEQFQLWTSQVEQVKQVMEDTVRQRYAELHR